MNTSGHPYRMAGEDMPLSIIVRELRSPLQSIMGALELLKTNRVSAEDCQLIDMGLRSVEHATQLLERAESYDDIAFSNDALEWKEYDLLELFEDIIDLAQPIAAQKGIEFRYVVDTVLPKRVVGDPLRVKEIALNLFYNALTYSNHSVDHQGVVTLAIGVQEVAQESQLVIAISDNGPGIPADIQDKIFQPFARLGDEQTQAPEIGLGLSIAKHTLGLMSGAITVSSEIGRGSCFKIEVPFELADEQSQPLVGLVVDPTPIAADKTLLHLLGSLGAEVSGVGTAVDIRLVPAVSTELENRLEPQDGVLEVTVSSPYLPTLVCAEITDVLIKSRLGVTNQPHEEPAARSAQVAPGFTRASVLLDRLAELLGNGTPIGVGQVLMSVAANQYGSLVSQRELPQKLGMNRRSVSRYLAQLSDVGTNHRYGMGLIELESSIDKRTHMLCLSESGQAVLKEIIATSTTTHS